MEDTESLESYAKQGLLLKHVGSGPNKPAGKLTYIAGGGVDEACVTLRFFGAHLDPDVLTQMLGCQPTTARRKGEIVREYWIATTGVWFFCQARSDMLLAFQIQQLFECLSDDQGLWDDLQQFTGELFCGLWCHT